MVCTRARATARHFAEATKDIGFSPLRSDPCQCTYGSCDEYMVMRMYVDVPLLGQAPSVVAKVKKKLMENFSRSALGKASLGLGMEIAQTGTDIVITQHKYVCSILTWIGV